MKVLSAYPVIWTVQEDELEDRLDAQGYHPTKLNTISKLKLMAQNRKWRVIKLKDVAKVLHSSIDPQKYPYREFTSIGVGDVSSETGWASEQKVRGIELLSQKVHFKKGDILFSKIRPYLNKVTSIPNYLKEGLASSEFYIVRAKKEKDRYYLWIFLRSKLTLGQTVPPLTGSSRPRLRKEDIEDIMIIISSEDFKNDIIKKVEMAESFRERANTLQLELKALEVKLNLEVPKIKRAISFIVKAEDMISRLDSEFYYYMYKIPEILKKYPYTVKDLEEVAEISNKRLNPKKRPSKEFRYVEIANVNATTGEIESWSRILGAEAPSRARMVLRAGDIGVSSLKGSLKAIAIVPEELDNSVGTTGFFVLKPNEEIINKESLWWVLRTDVCQRQLEQLASGAIMAAINEKDFRTLKVPIPPPEIQKEIKAKVEEIQKLRKEAKKLVKEAVKQVEELIEGEQ